MCQCSFFALAFWHCVWQHHFYCHNSIVSCFDNRFICFANVNLCHLLEHVNRMEKEILEGDAERGRRLFKQLCALCHNIAAGARHKTGPNLYGIAGQKSGHVHGYEYTDENVNKGTLHFPSCLCFSQQSLCSLLVTTATVVKVLACFEV